MDAQQRSPRFPGLLIFLSALVFSFSGLTSKWMPWDAYSLMGSRALVAVIVMIIARRSIKVRLNFPTILASLAVAATSLFFLMANKLTSAANAIVLQYAMPAFVILMCAVFLRQMPTRLDIITAVLVLTGVVLCCLDSLGGGSAKGNLFAICSAVTYALVFFCARLPDCDPFDYTYLGNVISSLFVVHLSSDPAVTSDPMPWLVAVLMGVLLSGGYLLFSAGMKHTTPVVAAILSNIEPVLNPIWVYLVMGEQPGPTAIVGTAVVLLSVTAYSYLQRRREPKPGL